MPSVAELIRQRLADGPLILDGATGTELQRRGVATGLPLWSATALLECPAVVEAIHRDYVAAGADIIVANTFRTNPRTLRRAGRFGQGAALNRLAIDLARRAGIPSPERQRRVEVFHASAADQSPTQARFPLVAASVAPVEDCYRPDLVPDDAELRAEHEQMIAWLQAARPDLLWIETMNTVREARAAAMAAAATGLPFVVSYVTQETGALLSGESLADAVAAVEPLEPLAIGLNCIPPRGLTANLARLRELTARALVAYAHINNPTPTPGCTYSQTCSPDEYAMYARQWQELGAQILGGCCGTMPAHIAALREVLPFR